MARLFRGDEPWIEEEERPGQHNDQGRRQRIRQADPPGTRVRQSALVGTRAAPITIDRIQPTTATTIAPRNAAPNPSTWNPSES